MHIIPHDRTQPHGTRLNISRLYTQLLSPLCTLFTAGYLALRLVALFFDALGI